MFDYGVITENEARTWAEEIEAIYHTTSALNGSGIKELFHDIGEKILERKVIPIGGEDSNEDKNEVIKIGDKDLSKIESNENNDNIDIDNNNNSSCCCSKKINRINNNLLVADSNIIPSNN